MADPAAGRRPRADALRNRKRLLAVAQDAFAAGEVAIALDEVARRAGVGIGTLYRHFPTREALLGAAYRAQVEALGAAAEALAAREPPAEALRRWLLLFVDYLETKRLIAPALEAIMAQEQGLLADTGAIIKDAARKLAANVVAAGAMRDDVDPIDLLRALAGIATAAPDPDWSARARRMVDILMAGAREEGAPHPFQGECRITLQKLPA